MFARSWKNNTNPSAGNQLKSFFHLPPPFSTNLESKLANASLSRHNTTARAGKYYTQHRYKHNNNTTFSRTHKSTRFHLKRCRGEISKSCFASVNKRRRRLRRSAMRMRWKLQILATAGINLMNAWCGGGVCRRCLTLPQYEFQHLSRERASVHMCECAHQAQFTQH